MTVKEIKIRILKESQRPATFCLDNHSIEGRFGDRGDGPRVRQVFWELIKDGPLGWVKYSRDSWHVIPIMERMRKIGPLPNIIPNNIDQLFQKGAISVEGLLPAGEEFLKKN